MTVQNFINKYGEKDGVKRFSEWLEKIRFTGRYHSKISQILFWGIYNCMPQILKDHCHFNDLNGEYFLVDVKNKQHYLYDFVISNIKFCIEFNGDNFHANPLIYKETDTPNPFNKDQISSQIWFNDEKKIRRLKEERDYDTFIVWESEYRKNEKEIQDKYLKIINERYLCK